MSVTLTNIETLVRYLLGDISSTQIPGDIFTYGTSSIFTLSESNVISVTDVLINDETSGVDYTYDSSTGKVTVNSSLTAGDTVEVQYTYYSNYSSTEIQSYIRAAIMHLSTTNYYTWIIQNSTIFPEPEENEKNLIATITAILMEPDNRTYRLPDITIVTPKDLPTVDKIRKTIAVFKRNIHGIFTISGN